MFKGPQGFGRMMNILMCAIMCAVLSIAIPLIIEGATGAQGLLNPIGFVQSFVLSFCIASPFGDLVPAVAWGGTLAARMGASGPVAYLIQCVVTAVLLITCIAFTVSFVNNIATPGGMGAVTGFFAMIWPGALGFGFLAILLTLGPCMKVAAKATGFDPAAAAAAA